MYTWIYVIRGVPVTKSVEFWYTFRPRTSVALYSLNPKTSTKPFGLWTYPYNVGLFSPPALSGLGRCTSLHRVSSIGTDCNTILFYCLRTALDSGTVNHSKNVLRRYEIFRRCQTPITKHKAPKPSRLLIFPLVLGAKTAKSKENIPTFTLLLQNLLLFIVLITDMTPDFECYLTIINLCPF